MEEKKTNILKAWEYKFYGYVNTVVSGVYLDAPMEYPFPAAYISDLYKYATNDYFLDSDFDSIYTYFSTSKSGNAPVGIFSKCARKTDSTSVCRYTQAAGWAWSEGELYRDAFDSILSFGFYSEKEASAIATREAAPAFGQGSDSGNLDLADFTIHPSALRALICSAFLRWMRSDPLIRIGVPSKYVGEAYNSYVLSAVNKLYSYFPVGLRLKAGFSSYLPAGKEKGLPCLYFGFVPESEADRNTVFLDGSSLAAYQKLPKAVGRDSLDFLINTLLETEDPHQRQILIGKLFADGDGGSKIIGLTPTKYYYIADTLKLMKHSESSLEMMPTWYTFCKDPSKYPTSLVQDLKDLIRTELTKPVFSAYLEQEYPNGISLEVFAETYPKAAVFLNSSDVVGECFWDRAEEILSKSAAEAVLPFLQENEAGLKKFDKQRYEQCMSSTKNRLAEEVKAAALGALDRKNQQASTCQQCRDAGAQVQEAVKNKLAPYLDNTKIESVIAAVAVRTADHIAALVEKDFLSVEAIETVKIEDVRLVIQKAEALMKQLAKNPGDKTSALCQQIQHFLSEKRELLGDRGLIQQKLEEDFEKDPDYFHAILYISKTMQENDFLQPEDQEMFLQKASQKKPDTEHAYFEAYARSTGAALVMKNLRQQDALLMRTVLLDLQLFFALPLRLNSPLNAQAMYDSIVKRQALVRHFTGKAAVTVEVDGNSVDADLLKAALLLNTSNTDTEKWISYLMKQGAYNGKDLPKLCTLYARNGLKKKGVLTAIFAGSFANASKSDCLQGLEILYQALNEAGKSPLENIEGVLKEQPAPCLAAEQAFKTLRQNKLREKEKDSALASAKSRIAEAQDQVRSAEKRASEAEYRAHDAESQVNALEKKLRKRKKGGAAVAFAVVFATLFLGTAAAGGLLYLRDKSIHADLEAQIYQGVQTQASLESDIQTKEAAMETLSKEFSEKFQNMVQISIDGYVAPLRAIAATDVADPVYQMYNTHYTTQDRDQIVTTVNGCDVTWGEYFLWKCYFLSQTQEEVTPEAFTQEEITDQISAVLRLLYGDTDNVPAPTAQAIAAEPTSATEATEATEITEAVEEAEAAASTDPTAPAEDIQRLSNDAEQIIVNLRSRLMAIYQNGQAPSVEVPSKEEPAAENTRETSEAAEPTEATIIPSQAAPSDDGYTG